MLKCQAQAAFDRPQWKREAIRNLLIGQAQEKRQLNDLSLVRREVLECLVHQVSPLYRKEGLFHVLHRVWGFQGSRIILVGDGLNRKLPARPLHS